MQYSGRRVTGVVRISFHCCFGKLPERLTKPLIRRSDAEKTGTFTNTDHAVQLGRQAIDPPGDARQDLWIIRQIVEHMGLNWHYHDVSDVFDEMRRCMPSIAGITWERLQREGGVTYPCTEEDDPGQPVVFTEQFPTSTGRARFVPFCYYEAAINKLTNPALDPYGKIPEFKYCAIRVTTGGEAPEQGSFGGGKVLRSVRR